MLSAQNTGTMSFSVTTNKTNQSYDPKNIMAVWITDDDNNFVQTIKKRADRREQYLYQWIENSNRNTVNAVTGATLSAHQAHNLTWNCQDVSGNTVQDGWYKVRCEFTTRNGQGPWTPVDYIRFYKGSDTVNTSYTDYNYNSQLAFSKITLAYTPDLIGLDEDQLNPAVSDFHLYENYPNPFNPSTSIRFSLPVASQVSLKIYNISGQVMTTLVDQQLSQGNHKFQWQAINMPSGIYFYTLKSGSFMQTKRMLLLK